MNERTVLIIAHLHQASPMIPGLANYLSEYGWRAIVLTPPPFPTFPSKWRIVETPYPPVLDFWKRLLGLDPNEDLRVQIKNRLGIHSQKSFIDLLVGLVGEVVNYPDADRHWKTVAVAAVENLLKQEEVAAIISSSPPVTAHIIASELKKKYAVPWIAELRDLWTQNHNYAYGQIRKGFDRRLELKTLRSADVLVTVSNRWADSLRTLHASKKRICTITNGFDSAYMNGTRVDLPAKFTLTYTGRIYPQKQDPFKLFVALHDLIQNGTIDPCRIEVQFYTPAAIWIERKVQDAGLEQLVTQYGMVPHETALRKQRESHMLLLLNWEDPRGKGCYPLKVFEYLGAKRPILAIGGSGDDVVTDLLNETQAGRSCPDVDSIKQYLRESYQEYLDQGVVRYYGDETRVLKYSYKEMAAQFAAILDRVTGSNTA